MEFYKFFWDDLGNQLFFAINHFFSVKAVMPKAWGRTYIILIPKKEHPNLVKDYRPISQCNISYNIITKILANCLKMIIGVLVNREQCGFVPGRSLVDNIITTHEVVHSINQDRYFPQGCYLKLTLRKPMTLSIGMLFSPQ